MESRGICILVLALAGPALVASDQGPLQWSWRPVPHLYLYTVTQTTELATAGDHLHYVATLAWKVACLASAADIHADHVRLGATILNISASLDGPRSHHLVDTDQQTPEALSDPVFGQLFALVGGPRFLIDCDPRNGVVSAVSGGEQVGEAIARSSRPRPSDPTSPRRWPPPPGRRTARRRSASCGRSCWSCPVLATRACRSPPPSAARWCAAGRA